MNMGLEAESQKATVYTPDIFETKCDLAYRHVYDAYRGPGESVYEASAAVSGFDT